MSTAKKMNLVEMMAEIERLKKDNADMKGNFDVKKHSLEYEITDRGQLYIKLRQWLESLDNSNMFMSKMNKNMMVVFIDKE
jgi:predicted transcriptional regulator